MEALKETITNIIQELSTKKIGSRPSPEEWLKKILTRRELGHIKFHYFRKGTLGVLVDSAVWKHSFSLKKEKMLAGLQKIEPSVKEIRLSLGDV